MFNNHPYISSIVETYKSGFEKSNAYETQAIAFINELNSWVSETRRKMPTIDGLHVQSAPDVRSARPPSVVNAVKALRKTLCNGDKKCEAEAEEAEAGGGGATVAAGGQGGGSSRPSRKYKKSKRVLRRKSRSTRRR